MEGYISEIRLFAGNFAPRNWAYCDGSILSIAANTALFSLVGTTYGGNGQTTFALPDLRSRVAVGYGQGPGLSSYQLGQQGGTETTTLTTNNLPSHSHTASGALQTSDGPGNSNSPSGGIPAKAEEGTPYTTGASNGTGKADGVAVTVGNTGGSQPFSTIQPYTTINYIICLYGIFPSRN